MEIKYRILQFDNSPNYDLLKSFLDKLGCKYKTIDVGIEYRFPESDPLVNELKEFAIQHKIILDSGLYYDEAEIDNAEWVVATVGEFQYPYPEDSIEVTYNTDNYCYRCFQGAVQDRPFLLKKDFIQKQTKFLGLRGVYDEIFVRPEIRRLFEANGISGVDYFDVLHYKTRIPFPNVYQMKINIVAPPGMIVDELFRVTCKPHNEESYVKGIGQIEDRPGPPFCGRVRYHYPINQPIKFMKETLVDLPDFTKSYEILGNGIPRPRLILARKKVVQLVKKFGLRGLGFHRPVHLV